MSLLKYVVDSLLMMDGASLFSLQAEKQALIRDWTIETMVNRDNFQWNGATLKMVAFHVNNMLIINIPVYFIFRFQFRVLR